MLTLVRLAPTANTEDEQDRNALLPILGECIRMIQIGEFWIDTENDM